MVKEYYDFICQGKDVRQNLIALRRELKTEDNQRAFAYLLGGDFRVLSGLLRAEDPKIRRNAALILGGMETEDVLPFLYAAYQAEGTLFVRADYLRAMASLDCRPYLPKLKERLRELEETHPAEENEKHVREEQSCLRELIFRYEKPRPHEFTALDPAPEMILLTNRCQKGVVKDQILTGNVTELPQGLRVKHGDLREILRIRTWLELLFPIPGARPLSGSPEEMGRSLARTGVARLLEDWHRGEGSFYFRVELKSAMPLEKKGPWLRRFCAALEAECAGRLKNSAGEYEIELRLLERKDGSFLPLLKLYTLKDRRFTYRREALATSIAPANAALTVSLARKYLKEGAQVLDPFCGVGTMLIERALLLPCGSMYGIDILGDAIEKARKNTRRIGLPINYINRDFFDFTHEYLFDEIITDMPRGVAGTRAGRTSAASGEAARTGRGSENIGGSQTELAWLYGRFFERAKLFLKDQGVLVLYTMEPELVETGLRRHPEYHRLEEFLINEKNQTKVFVITVKK